MISLSGKRILVTGASSGIGRVLSQQASLLGASLILIGRNKDRLQQTYQNLMGARHEQYSVDITDCSQMEEIIHVIVTQNGPISGFVHCAGIEKTLPLKASKNNVFKEVFDTNVFAGFEIARIISQRNMFDVNGASFVFISSVMGKVGEPGKVVYCSSKSALLSGTKAMALELAPKKIRCNCVLPGIVETNMVKKLFETIPQEAKDKIIAKHPLGLGKPEDIASLIIFLLSDHAKWITGSEYIIDGGYSAH
jgi:NAD(P)-dependent dehydrogenase (short-subunit alcohol dehydrogenase family)